LAGVALLGAMLLAGCQTIAEQGGTSVKEIAPEEAVARFGGAEAAQDTRVVRYIDRTELEE
jgi:hypothetical protein